MTFFHVCSYYDPQGNTLRYKYCIIMPVDLVIKKSILTKADSAPKSCPHFDLKDIIKMSAFNSV